VPLRIDSVTVQPGLALAPMAGITNYPFRILAKEQGCPLLYSEMISARGLLYNGRRKQALLYFTDQERPIGFQLFGSDPLIMGRAAQKLEAIGVDFIDLNFGCPTRKITGNGEGGALMREPGRCSEIFKAVVGAVSCPVTVKLRKGWDEHSINVLEIAARAEDAGIVAVTVHGRTVDQGYSGRADWAIIGQVKKALTIPVIGNGDVDSPLSAEAMFSYCGCDGVMIGRAARGNPWIFKAVLTWLEERKLLPPPSIEQIVEMTLKQFSLLIELKGETAAAREMRRHAAWYTRGLPGASSVRQQLIRVSSFRETEGILYEFMRSFKEI
jgi:tRNA-dihydrouridine synthase B